MKLIPIIFLLLFLSSCDFKSSMDYNNEAEKLEYEGKYEEAILMLNMAVEKDPNNIYALLNRAVDKSLIQNYQGAIKDYTAVIKIDSKNTLAYLNRGKNKSRLENYTGAIDDYNLAIKTKGTEILYIDLVDNAAIDNGFEFDVKMEEILFERGFSYFKVDSINSAFKDFNFCINMNYQLKDCYLWRGFIYLGYDKINAACEDFKHAKKNGNIEAVESIKNYCGK